MNNKTNFKVEVNDAGKGGYGIIKLLDDQGRVLNISATKSNRDTSIDEMKKDMYKKILLMVLEADPNAIDTPQAEEIFKALGVSLTIDGKQIF